jgi:hypothetical protein
MDETKSGASSTSSATIEAIEPEWYGHGLWALCTGGFLHFAALDSSSSKPSPAARLETSLVPKGCKLASFPGGVFLFSAEGELQGFTLLKEPSSGTYALARCYRSVIQTGKPPSILSTALLPARRPRGGRRLALFCASSEPEQLFFYAEWATETVHGPPQRQLLQRNEFVAATDGFIHPHIHQIWLLCVDGELVILDESLKLLERHRLPEVSRRDRLCFDAGSGIVVIASETGALRCCIDDTNESISSGNHNVLLTRSGRLLSWTLTESESHAHRLEALPEHPSTPTRAVSKPRLTALCASDSIVMRSLIDGTVDFWQERVPSDDPSDRPVHRWHLKRGPLSLLCVDRQSRRIWGWSAVASILFCWQGTLSSLVGSRFSRPQNLVPEPTGLAPDHHGWSMREDRTPGGLISVTAITSSDEWNHLDVDEMRDMLEDPANDAGAHPSQANARYTGQEVEVSPTARLNQRIKLIQEMNQLEGLLEIHAKSMDTELETLTQRVRQLEDIFSFSALVPESLSAAIVMGDSSRTTTSTGQSPGDRNVSISRAVLPWQTGQLMIQDMLLSLRCLRGLIDAHRQVRHAGIEALRQTLDADGQSNESKAAAGSELQQGKLSLATPDMPSVLYELSERSCTLQQERDELVQALLAENRALTCRIQDLEQATQTLVASNQSLRHQFDSCKQLLEEAQTERDRLMLQLRSAVRVARFFTEKEASLLSQGVISNPSTTPKRTEEILRAPHFDSESVVVSKETER